MTNKVTYISVEELVRRIISICKANPFLDGINTNELLIQYDKNGLSHIWLHTYQNNNHHRVAYEKRYNADVYTLNHYVWRTDKGWVFVGQIKSNSIDNYRPNNF